MFAQTWRQHWGLQEEPFVHEDADKDPVLSKLEDRVVHSAFDRIFGDPNTPVPGVLFGEKGSGKSSLRLAMERRLAKHNEEQPDKAVLAVRYTDIDAYLDELRQNLRVAADTPKTTPKVLEAHTLADHLDAILSLGVSKLSDELMHDKARARRLNKKQRRDLLALAHVYYRSEEMAKPDATKRLKSALGVHTGRPVLFTTLRWALSAAGIALALVPHAADLGLPLSDDLARTLRAEDTTLWYALGGGLIAFTWLATWFGSALLGSKASRTASSVRVVDPNPSAFKGFLRGLKSGARNDLVLPGGPGHEASRYKVLKHFLTIMRSAGYQSLFVLLDRVDESTYLSAREEYMQPFVEQLLQHKLLQHDGLALKLFLPIELSRMTMTVNPEELKRMRLDKANTVSELRWTGQELYEIAGRRLAAVGNGTTPNLAGFFREEVRPEEVRDTLHELGTPRLCFGFLSSLMAEYARDLPDELDPMAEEWRIPRSHFEVHRAAWRDRARVMRRNMN